MREAMGRAGTWWSTSAIVLDLVLRGELETVRSVRGCKGEQQRSAWNWVFKGLRTARSRRSVFSQSSRRLLAVFSPSTRQLYLSNTSNRDHVPLLPFSSYPPLVLVTSPRFDRVRLLQMFEISFKYAVPQLYPPPRAVRVNFSKQRGESRQVRPVLAVLTQAQKSHQGPPCEALPVKCCDQIHICIFSSRPRQSYQLCSFIETPTFSNLIPGRTGRSGVYTPVFPKRHRCPPLW